MQNRQAQNTNAMNTGPLPYEILSQVWLINFGGFDLTECDELYIKEYDYDNVGTIVLESSPYPFIDGGAVLSYLTTEKTLNFKMIIRAENTEELNNKMDEIKRALVKKEKPLDIVVNGKRRRTLANLTSLNFNRDLNNSQIQMDVDLQFKTLSPHFRLKDPITSSSTLQTVNFFDIDFDNQWSAPTDYQIIFVFGTGNTGIQNITLTQSWFVIWVQANINNGDVLVFDGFDFSVKLNNIEIEYTGQFQRLELWSNPITIDFDGTAWNYWVTTKFLQQYR